MGWRRTPRRCWGWNSGAISEVEGGERQPARDATRRPPIEADDPRPARQEPTYTSEGDALVVSEIVRRLSRPRQ